MGAGQLIPVLLLTGFLFLYGMFSGARWALFSVGEEELLRIGREDDRRSRMLRRLLQSPRETSLSFLLGQRIALLGCVAAAWWSWRTLGHENSALGLLVGLPPLVILLGTAVPLRTFRRTPALYAYRLAIPLWLFHHGIGILRWSLLRATHAVLSLFPARTQDDHQSVLERQYLGLLEVGRREGVVESQEQRLIHRVFEFGDHPVSRAMTPRTDMFCLPLETDFDMAFQRVKEAGYSRVPVYQNRKDEVVGILYAKDLLRFRLADAGFSPTSLKELMHPPYFVPMHMGIDKLFQEFQRRKLHMALCVDEYGGVAGLVTMEDLLEEIFGEIYDECDLETRNWEPLDKGAYLVTGSTGLSAIGELLGADLRETDCRTVAGFVLNRLGRFPKRGEQVEAKGVRFRVEKVIGTRIQAVRVERLSEGEP